MTRNEVYRAIDQERNSQDSVWRTGRANEKQYEFAGSHILLIGENAEKLRSIWYGVKNEGSLQDRFIKIAAIAVRALEEIKVA